MAQFYLDRNISMNEFVQFLDASQRKVFLDNKVSVYREAMVHPEITVDAIYVWLHQNTVGKFVMNLFVYNYNPESENPEEHNADRNGELTGALYFENSADATKFAMDFTKLVA